MRTSGAGTPFEITQRKPAGAVRIVQLRRTRVPALHVSIVLVLLLAGCSHHKVAQENLPAPPPAASATAPSTASLIPSPSKSLPQDEDEKLQHFLVDAKPLMVETGVASWYGPPYHNRRGSDGKIYDMNAMTAAHRTLPLGSIVRVSNVKTGNWAIVRITDRGPFIRGRILDLSLAAAKRVDVVRPGIAQVRLEVLQTPAAIANGGRWAVQIGAFAQQESATKLVDEINRRYRTCRVSSFNSPVGDWWAESGFKMTTEAGPRKSRETPTPSKGQSSWSGSINLFQNNGGSPPHKELQSIRAINPAIPNSSHDQL